MWPCCIGQTPELPDGLAPSCAEACNTLRVQLPSLRTKQMATLWHKNSWRHISVSVFEVRNYTVRAPNKIIPFLSNFFAFCEVACHNATQMFGTRGPFWQYIIHIQWSWGYCSDVTGHWKEYTRSSWHWIINHILVQMTHKYVLLISDKRSCVPREPSHLFNTMSQSIHGLHSKLEHFGQWEFQTVYQIGHDQMPLWRPVDNNTLGLYERYNTKQLPSTLKGTWM